MWSKWEGSYLQVRVSAESSGGGGWRQWAAFYWGSGLQITSGRRNALAPGIKYHLPWRCDKQQSVIINHEHYPNGIVPLPRPCSGKLWLLLRMKKNQTNSELSCWAAWKLVFISLGFITFRAVLRNCWPVFVWMPWKPKHTNASLRQ